MDLGGRDCLGGRGIGIGAIGPNEYPGESERSPGFEDRSECAIVGRRKRVPQVDDASIR